MQSQALMPSSAFEYKLKPPPSKEEWKEEREKEREKEITSIRTP